MKKTNIALLALAFVLAVGATAAASVYLTKQSMEPEEKPVVASVEKPVVKHHNKTRKRSTSDDITWNQPAPAPQPAPQQVASNCDDGNIVGLIAGGAAGGLAGHQIGSGSGNTAATIGGAIGGAYLGKNYLPTRNVTCR